MIIVLFVVKWPYITYSSVLFNHYLSVAIKKGEKHRFWTIFKIEQIDAQ